MLFLVEWEAWTQGGLLVLGSILAFWTGARTLGAYAIVGVPSLRRFGLGFLALGISQVAAIGLHLAVLLAPVAIDTTRIDQFDALFWTYYSTLLAGLIAVFASFGRHPFQWAPALYLVLLVAGPLLQFAVIIALFFIVLHAGLNHIQRKATGSSRVAIGFFFLLGAHILNLAQYGPLTPRTLLGEALNLGGLLILLASVLRPSPPPVSPHA